MGYASGERVRIEWRSDAQHAWTQVELWAEVADAGRSQIEVDGLIAFIRPTQVTIPHRAMPAALLDWLLSDNMGGRSLSRVTLLERGTANTAIAGEVYAYQVLGRNEFAVLTVDATE